MGFWTLSDGSEVKSTTSFEMGGSIEPIPNNTNLKACIEEILWKAWEEDEYIEAKWTVLDGEFKGRKVFQKIRVKDSDDKKRSKAIQMLAAIDANCGGRLAGNESEPTDDDLIRNLANKPMVIKVMIWEMNDKKGNWVAAVSPGAAQPQNSKPVDPDNLPF